MRRASAGKAIPRLMGDYNANTTYYIYDVVHYGVSSYILKVAESTGNLPTNTSYWQVYAEGISNISPEALGIGYGISSDSGSARTATLSDYNLTPNGIVAVTFGADVPANATLNINSQGAKPIYFRGSAIVANVIKGGDTVTFAYDGTHYDILCIDGGAGHKILNSAGTELTQRDTLQASDGLEFVDDSTNQRTKVKMNLPIVSFEDWNAMTEQEKTAYIASHYRFGVELPDTSGVINAEYMKLLWENTNTSQAFAAQTITLNSADYDFLLCLCAHSTSDAKLIVSSLIVKKGSDIHASQSYPIQSGARVYMREFTRVSDTSYNVGDSKYATGTTASTTDNAVMIPLAIYGIKSSFQFKVNAIASELSTRADHCFLDDETTTVEDALDNAGRLTLIEETSAIASSGTATVTITNPSKIKELVLVISYSQAFEFASAHNIPMLAGISFRSYHYINGNSVGTMQALLSNDLGTLVLSNQINEAVKVRVYKKA